MRELPGSRSVSPRPASHADPTDRAAQPALAVTGLRHLGCTILAAWLLLGRRAIAIDPAGSVISELRAGKVPVQEPGVLEGLTEGFFGLTAKNSIGAGFRSSWSMVLPMSWQG